MKVKFPLIQASNIRYALNILIPVLKVNELFLVFVLRDQFLVKTDNLLE